MSAALILAILGSGGLGAIIVAFIGAVSSKKKLGAEATEIIARAAAGVVENVTSDNKALRSELEAIRDFMDRLRDTLQLHAAWDSMAAAKLAEYGIRDLPPVPPLYPPQKPNGDGPRISVSETTRP